MEKYVWYDKDKVEYILEIGDEQDRFNGEGILQLVTLVIIDDTLFFPKNEYYETTYGRYVAIAYFNNINIDEWENDDMVDFNKFKSWIITSLTPITEQRKVKIEKIKEKHKILFNN